eukprot:TRINITY_DN1235_c1_g3_i1.p6 TRINITY_DN1235_c1_g3~~TRINITY_DN1235_c1_g3_i1.p6  ORF type:complete len:107 (-),score=1.71 TRINITY_DN1235_c1_g3_i1:45-365(-)
MYYFILIYTIMTCYDRGYFSLTLHHFFYIVGNTVVNVCMRKRVLKKLLQQQEISNVVFWEMMVKDELFYFIMITNCWGVFMSQNRFYGVSQWCMLLIYCDYRQKWN